MTLSRQDIYGLIILAILIIIVAFLVATHLSALPQIGQWFQVVAERIVQFFIR